MGIFGDMIEARLRTVNPRYNAMKEAREYSDAVTRGFEGTNPYKSPVDAALNLFKQGNPQANALAGELYSQYQSGKPAGARTFDYVETLTPEEKLRWFAQNEATIDQEIHSTFRGDNGNMWTIWKNGKTMDTGVPYREPTKTVMAGGIPYDQFGRPIVSAEEAARNAAAKESAVTDARIEATANANTRVDEPLEELKLNHLRQKIGQTQQAILEAKSLANNWSSGLIATEVEIPYMGTAGVSHIGGTEANALRTRLDTITASLGFDELQQIRDVSKTGGALGQVTERELDLLQSTVAKLDQRLEPEDLKKQLDMIMGHYTNVLKLAEALYERRYGKPAATIVDEGAGGAAPPPKGAPLTTEELIRGMPRGQY